MAINETISTGNKYRRLKDASTKLWQRLSFWTKASDVEFDNGATAETSLGNIQGITDSVNSNASNIAASAAAVNTLNSNITTQTGRINVYVGDDKNLHFVNSAGADTVLNFSKLNEVSEIYNKVITSNGTNPLTTNIDIQIGEMYYLYFLGLLAYETTMTIDGGTFLIKNQEHEAQNANVVAICGIFTATSNILRIYANNRIHNAYVYVYKLN